MNKMKKRTKIILVIFLVIVTLTGIIIPLIPFMMFTPAYGTPSFEFPMVEPLNVTSLSVYNTPDWGEPGTFHNGIDLVISGPTQLISPCYGIVNNIWYNINPYSEGVAMIHVSIMVNYGWSLKLVFEPWANTTEIREQQLAAIVVKVGDKVKPGDLIGTLLYNYEYPHLHYMIMHNGNDVCPFDYSSAEAKEIFFEIATRTNTTISYP